ncbi:11503_t:CDS:2 [Diversispora eburnea]|uniref:11503_t:CDS:1 n=1 Tax=Diversispora eburnea TaxID=1213867 RepID=A0A9N8YHV1_9GLOM|nr:11503_t:CDS:2 [Diversispora eburnea]
MCCSKASWKRGHVQDHKFDFVDIDEFYERSCIRKLKYLFVWLIVLKSVAVYIADMWTAGILLIFDRWGSAVQPKIPFYISKWIYVGCIFVSFILLGLDMRKARNIIKSKDISYAFTSVIAYRSYVLKSYRHFCFFSQINNSKKTTDNIAFFVFFTFKGWKRLMFAEAPRQAISAFTLYSLFQSKKAGNYLNLRTYGDTFVQQLVTALMAFTLLIFKSMKRQEQRQLEEKAEAMGDFSHLKKKKSSIPVAPTILKPTLPKFEDERIQSAQPIQSIHPIKINNNNSNNIRIMTGSPEPIINSNNNFGQYNSPNLPGHGYQQYQTSIKMRYKNYLNYIFISYFEYTPTKYDFLKTAKESNSINEKSNLSNLPILDYNLVHNIEHNNQFLKQLRDAIINVGFLYVKNAPISKVNEIKWYSKKLFDLPMDEKLRIEMKNSPHFLGYNCQGMERTLNLKDNREQFDFATEM